MKSKQQNYGVPVSSFIGGFIGVFFHLSITEGGSLGWDVIWSVYWAFFLALIITLIDATFRLDTESIYTIGNYSSTMGCLGSFLGMVLMTKHLASAISTGGKDAILAELAGFSICLITSIIGITLFIITLLLASMTKRMKADRSKANE